MRLPQTALLVLAVAGWLLSGSPLQAIKRKPAAEVRGHPELVLISAKQSKGKEVSVCSGTLIAPNVVLTAGHCVDGFDQFAVSAPYAKKGADKATSTTPRKHPQFKRGDFEHDLAVLILDQDMDVGGKLPALYRGNLYPINTPLLVIGRVENGTISNSKLFQTQVVLVQFPGSINVYGANPQVIQHGDSGGPIFVAGKEQEIAAVVSGSISFSRWNVPTDLYVPISNKNRDWILRQVPRRAGDPGK